MAINTEFYTNPHSWSPSITLPDIKIADWTYTGAMDGSIGALTMQSGELGIELDTSIIPWKINENSDVMRRQYAYGQMDYSNTPWSAYTQVHKGKKRGYRFILGGQGTWIASSAPSNVPNPKPLWNSRHDNWTDLNTYSTTGFNYEKYLIPFVDFNYHETIAYYTISYVNKSWYPSYPDEAPYNPSEIAPSQLTDSWLSNNWVVGFNVYLYSGGLNTVTGSYEQVGYRCQFIPFDRVHSSLYHSSEFDAYGQDTLQYWNSFLHYGDGRDNAACSIGGYYGRWSIIGHQNPTASDWYTYGNKGGYSAYDMPDTLGGVIDNVDSDETDGEYSQAHMAFKGGSSWNYLSGAVKDYNSMTADEIKSYMRTQLAYLGFIFTEWLDNARYGFNPNNASQYYVPEIDADGVTTGNYKPYPESDYDNTDWTTGVPDVTPYNPETDIPDEDPNEYDDNTTELNNVSIIPRFTTRYILSTNQITHAHGFLMSEISSNVDSDFWSSQMLYVNNPIDVVQSVLLFPFDISDFQTDEPSYTDLAFGQLIDTGYSVQLNREQYCIIDMGSCTYYPKLGNNDKDFRNYPPYSSATLYIPYCGSVEIDANLYMNHRISVKLIVDMATGSCLALVYRDNMVTDSISGTIGISFPITGIQSQTLAAAERQAETQLKMARINGAFTVANSVTGVSGGAASGAAAGLMTGGLAGAIAGGIIGGASKAVSGTQNIINGVQDIRNAQYNLEHVQVPYKTIGTATASTSWANERKCRLIIRRPLMLSYNDETYAHNCGYACLKTATVGEFSGYTVFQTVNLDGITATETEKAEIFRLLQGGVYL